MCDSRKYLFLISTVWNHDEEMEKIEQEEKIRMEERIRERAKALGNHSHKINSIYLICERSNI